MSETIPVYHSNRCCDCGALLPSDDWSSVRCQSCTPDEPANEETFWATVARLHQTYGTLADEG